MKTTSNSKERPNLLVEVMSKTYCKLRTMAKKFKKFGQVESIVMNLKNTLNIEMIKVKTKH